MPDFSRKSLRTAKKPHECYECGRTIAPGERYENVFSVWSGWRGQRSTYTTCQACADARLRVMEVTNCHCYLHGGLFEELENYARFWIGKPGDRFAIGRLAVQFNRRQAEATP